MKTMKTSILISILGPGLVVLIGVGFWGERRLAALHEERDALAIKAQRFDSFCEQQSGYLGIVVSGLQSGNPSKRDVAASEFDEVFVTQAGERELGMCLDGPKWDHSRAEDCSAEKDVPCMVDVAHQTMGLLDAATRGGP